MKYSQKIRLQDVAEKFHIHPNYMTRIFREKFQVAPKQYLMELKLKKAGRLLDTTELPVAMISSSLGFEDQMDFSKTFRKKYGMSPSAYRQEKRRTMP